jgi:hypothetical protein
MPAPARRQTHAPEMPSPQTAQEPQAATAPTAAAAQMAMAVVRVPRARTALLLPCLLALTLLAGAAAAAPGERGCRVPAGGGAPGDGWAAERAIQLPRSRGGAEARPRGPQPPAGLWAAARGG